MYHTRFAQKNKKKIYCIVLTINNYIHNIHKYIYIYVSFVIESLNQTMFVYQEKNMKPLIFSN